MQCRACGAQMLLMHFALGDTTGRVPAIERQEFKCSACPQVARRVLFSHAVISPDNVPLATHTDPRAIQPQTMRSATPQMAEKTPSWVMWARAVEKVHRRQAELRERAAASTRSSEVVSGPVSQLAGAGGLRSPDWGSQAAKRA